MIFWIPGTPIGKGRPRFVAGRAITPARTRDWERWASQWIAIERKGEELKGPLKVSIRAIWPRPQSRPSEVPLEVWRDSEGQIWRPSTPDVDNVSKAVLDACEKSGLFADDRRVVSLRVVTVYAERGGAEGVQIEVKACGWEMGDTLVELMEGGEWRRG